MKKVQKQLKRALSMVLAFMMVVGMLSGCGVGQSTAPDTEAVQDTVTEVQEVILSSIDQKNFLLSAGETQQPEYETANGNITDVTVTPDDVPLVPYQYYTVTITLMANENERFAKKASISLNGVELKVKKWAKDKLVIEYTTLALPETVTTDEMAKVTGYGDTASKRSLGTAKVQALLDCELTLFSEDGKKSYMIQKGYVPLFMVPSFVANGEPEQIKDGERVQIIKEHGEEDFPGADGEWYKVAYNGKTGYLPVTFVKDAKLQAGGGDTEKTPKSTVKAKKNTQTRPAADPEAVQNIPAVVQNTPAAGQTASNNSGNSSNSNSGSSQGGNSGSSSDNSSGGNSGSDSDNSQGDDSGNDSGNIDKTVYYQIDFAIGGGISSKDAMLPKAMMVVKDSALDINQLATASVPGYLFEAWYYDPELTRQVRTGDRINGNTTLYAKVTEITGDDVAQGQDNYVASEDVDAKTFKIALLKSAGSRSAEKVEDVAKIYDLADQESAPALNISNPEMVTIEENTYEKYYISSDELQEGITYQMKVLDSSYFIYFNDQIQPAAVRLYNFTTKMDQVENLVLNDKLVYLKEADVTYTEGSDYLSGLFQVDVNDDMTKLNTVEGSGSFTYTGSQKISVGTTVVIYDGEEAPHLGEDVTAAQQYDGNAAYVTISKVEGNTYFYGVAEAADVLFTPDVLPVNVADDEDTSNTTVTIDTAKLDYSDSVYQGMGLDENTTVDVGDYLAFYSGSLETADELTYGKITAITVSGEDTILTYTDTSESEVLDSMTVYSTEEMDFELDEDTAKSIEKEIEKDAVDSGFALEAANYLATVALATEELQTLTGDMGLQDLTLTKEDGSAATRSDLQLMAGNSVSVEGLRVTANISRKLEHLGSGNSKNGANAKLEISFNIKIGSGKNQLTLKVAAAFEQEILLNLNIKGKAVWGKKWIFRYIKDYRITTNLDAGSYTGINVTATILAEGSEPEYDWSDVNDNLSDQIHKLMDTQDKFFNDDISSGGGGLAEKYANMLENNPDWIDLVNVNIFSNESRILAGIIVVGVQGDFVISAKVNIMLGMSFQYSVAKRYTFTLNVFGKTSSSDCVDLTKSNYQFDMYVMGTLGLRAGIRLTVYAGLFSKKVAAIGVTAEAGAYVQMWGYFYYSTSWQSGSGKSSSASGAMLLEVGAYLEIRFLATAFGGTFKYAPVLYDKYWPLWNMGSVENVYGFNYETTVGEADDKDIVMGASTSVALPADRLDMSCMNLRSGETADKIYTYSDFDITTTGNFKYENGIISVIPQDGSNEEKGTVTLTWKGAPLSFTSKPLSCEMDITWSDPSRVNTVSYDLNGGTAYKYGEALAGGIEDKVVITGAAISAPEEEIKKDGYTFDGWYLDEDGTNVWNFDTDKVREDVILHAKWILVDYEITYVLDGGTNAENNPASYTVENAVTLEDPVRAGYRFAGWYTAADDTGSRVMEISAGSTGARTLYAQWTAVEQIYEIHHMIEKLDGSGYEEAEVTEAAAPTGTTVTIGKGQSKAYDGFTFNESRMEDSTGIIPGEGTLKLKLYYSRNQYDVTFVSGTKVNPETQSVPYQGKATEPEAPSREGYEFTGWYASTEALKKWDFAENKVAEAVRLIAGWKADTYNVTLDRQGGTGGDENVQAVYDSSMPGITIPIRAGYQFLGYYDAAENGNQYYNADGSSASNWNKAGNDKYTLYAKWSVNRYQVAFDANGGTGSMADQNFTYDVNQPLSTNTFTREGYTFAGWAKVENADKAAYTDGAVVENLTTEADQTVTLYAVWKPVTYQVIFDKNGADSGSMNDQTLTYDAETSLSVNGYTKTGYHFMGWAVSAGTQTVAYADSASVKNLTAAEGSTITLYAVWEVNTYSVRFDANGGVGSQMEPQVFTYDADAVELSSNTYSRDNYTFEGWSKTNTAKTAEYKDKQAVKNLVTTQNGELILYAVWKPYSFQVTLNANGGTWDEGTDNVVTMRYGQTCGTLSEPKRYGYTLRGWSLSKDDETSLITPDTLADTIAGRDAIYAIWTPVKVRVTFALNDDTGSSKAVFNNADGSSNLYYDYVYDSQYKQLHTVERTGYTFAGWYTSQTGGTKVGYDTVINQAEAYTLYAHWTANSYQVTLHAMDGSFSDGTTEKYVDQKFDNTYSLTYTPRRTGYAFEGWYTSQSAGDRVTWSTSMTTAGPHDLYAHWTANSYQVTYDANGGNFTDNTTAKTISLIYGKSYQLPGTPAKSSCVFEGWYTEAEGGSKVDEDTLMNTAAKHTLYAHWREIKLTTVKVGGIELKYLGTPVYAKTNETGAVTIGGSSSDYNIKLEEDVLTLKDATIIFTEKNNAYSGAIYSEDELTIKLMGSNSVKNNTTGVSVCSGIYIMNNSLTIQGSKTGSLEAAGVGTGIYSRGITANRGITIDGATVTAQGGAANSASCGIYADSSVNMINGANVTAVGGEATYGSYGIEAVDVNINKSSGHAYTTATSANEKWAIYRTANSDIGPSLTGASITSGSAKSKDVKWCAD